MNEISCTSRITEVTIYPHSGRISRQASVSVSPGENWVVINNLPPNLSDDSVKASVSENGKIIEFSIETRTRYAQSDEANGLEKRIQELENCSLRLLDGLKAKDKEFEIFSDRAELSKLIDRENPKIINPTTWGEFLDFLEKKLLDNRNRAREDYLAYLDTLEELNAQRVALNSIASHQSWGEKIAKVLIHCEQPKELVITLIYMQGSISWHPAYTLRFQPEGMTVDLNFFAMIKQETGEKWDAVGLGLSTAMPLENCSLPVIQSKRLKEAQSQIPIVQASVDDLMSSYDEEERDEGRPMAEKAKERKGAPMKKTASRSVSAKVAEMDYFGSSVGGMPAGSMDQPAPAPMAAAPPKAALNMPSPTQSSMVYPNIQNWESRFTSTELPRPSLFHEWTQFQLLTPLILPSELTQGGNSFFNAGDDPGVTSGGYDYRYQIQKKENSLLSKSEYTQVQVENRKLDFKLVHVTLPCESPHVYLKALFQNSQSPLLRGPAQVFLENDFICDLHLDTVGTGQEASVSLGVDKDIKILRKEETKSRTTGIGFRDQVTDFEVTLEVLNSKNISVDLEIYDRIPQGAHPKAPQPFDVIFSRPPDKTSERGIILWKLLLKPGEKHTITIKYSLKVPQDFQIVLTRSPQAHEGLWKEAQV